MNPLWNRGDFGAPGRGRMDSFTTRNAGLASGRGGRLFAKAAFAFAAVAMASVLAASITDFDLLGWVRNPASANVSSANSVGAGLT